MVYGLYKRSALHEVMPLRKVLVADQLLVTELSLKGEFVTVPEKLVVRRVRRVSRSSQAIARALGTSRLHVWFRCEVQEVMWLRLIFQSDKFTLRERIVLAFWSFGKYAQISVYHGPLLLLAYKILLALCPKAARHVHELWRGVA